MTDSARPDPSAAAVLAAYEAVEDLLTFTPIQTGRFGGWTPARQRQFIVALAATGTVERSCKAVGMTVQGAYKLRKRPDAAEFAHAWDEALMQGRERAYDIAIDRALNGYTTPRYYRGRQIGTKHQYDNRMIMHALQPPHPPASGRGGPAPMSLTPREVIARDLERRRDYARLMDGIAPAAPEDDDGQVGVEV